MEYKNENSGALFTNDRKETDNHPDLKGTINVDGQDYWISAWNKTSKAGNDYISLSVQKKEVQGSPEHLKKYERPEAPGPHDDDVPF